MPDHTRHDLVLAGCRPEPLASYLKALGVFRGVAEQADPDARGAWRGEHFVLHSKLDSEGLLAFFASDWRPTPVISPWNGGSGFYPKDNRTGPDAICASEDPRLAAFRTAIELARSFVAQQGWVERPEKNAKQMAISRLRAILPDDALAWLDAAVVLGDDQLLFPPLLGTGGNDGRLDFSNNFQQRVVEVLSGDSRAALESALFGSPAPSRFKGAMGQFLPSVEERSNPWDFVLLIEGAMMFAAAATRRCEALGRAMLAYPFHARAAGGVATVADADEDESRDELWLPLWSAPASLRAIQRLFAEGRATVGSGDAARPATTGLDFARAVTSLGVDRGIEAFSRIGFHVRNGLAYFATPLGRFATGDVRSARLLDEVDGWYERFRSKASSKNAPASIALARRRLEQAMFDAVANGAMASVLIELGQAEKALVRSLDFTRKAFLDPVPQLSASWAEAVEDSSIEQRLAAALAGRRAMRRRLVPLAPPGPSALRFGSSESGFTVFKERGLVDNLHALLLREDIEEQQGDAADKEPARARCTLSDIAHFIAGRTNDTLIERWLRALSLLERGLWPALPAVTVLPPATFGLLALVHGRRLGHQDHPVLLPRTTGMLAHACAGHSVLATEASIRRLNASDRPLPVPAIFEPSSRTRRIAAALAFPLTSEQRREIERMVLPRAIAEERHPVHGEQENA